MSPTQHAVLPNKTNSTEGRQFSMAKELPSTGGPTADAVGSRASSLELFRRFRSVILAANECEIRSDPTLGGRLTIAREADIAVTYAPFDHVNSTARVVIVGITPGAQQASNALLSARAAALRGLNDYDALAEAKTFASFCGQMRTNLVDLLDHVGLAAHVGVRSCASLWEADSHLVHFTSALRYPVFFQGANYAGSPSMTKTSVLRDVLREHLAAEAAALSNAVWVPLGPKAAEGIREVVRMGKLDPACVLEGLPHPSGANAERIAYFLHRKARDKLSTKTNAAAIDAAQIRIVAQVSALAAAV